VLLLQLLLQVLLALLLLLLLEKVLLIVLLLRHHLWSWLSILVMNLLLLSLHLRCSKGLWHAHLRLRDKLWPPWRQQATDVEPLARI
jgi:hypothetical protein